MESVRLFRVWGSVFGLYGVLPAVVFEDLEDIVYESFAFVGGEVSGVDGLFVGLEVSRGSFLGEVLVYEADDSVNFLTGEAITAAG